MSPFLHLLRHSILLAFILFHPAYAGAATDDNDPGRMAQSLLHTLDYLAVDYPGVVSNGEIINPTEYTEQREFAQQLRLYADRLPANEYKVIVLQRADQIRQAVERRASGEEVTRLCNELSAKIIRTYQINTAPKSIPVLTNARTLYSENCISCHGAGGFGDGPDADQHSPAPANFHDRSRQKLRSVYGLYSTITLGVDGTAMKSFIQLSDEQRWGLAFYVSDFYATDGERRLGKELWDEGKYRKEFTDLSQLTQMTPEQIQASHGEEGLAVLAYLREKPLIVATAKQVSIEVAKNLLQQSLDTYRDENHQQAYELALAAYLEGFELAETSLRSIDSKLKHDIEVAMMSFRQSIKDGVPADELASKEASLQIMLDQANDKINSDAMSPGLGMFSAFIILIREGLEAMLVLGAIAAFLNKAGRRDAIRYMHAGWISALAAGMLTWLAAKNLITLSGASRELIEGGTALLVAAMLVYVGFWLHNHSHAQRWKDFINAKLHTTLSEGTLWSLVLISFIAVYREVLETVLFYETLWLQAGDSNAGYLFLGIAAAAVMLLGLAWAIFRLSVRLPLGLFFQVNAAIMYVLAVVFAGKGVANLQEAGKIPADHINFPEIDFLGVYPTLQGLGLQGLLILLAVVWIGYNWISGRKQATSR